jgi:hypothetical protein
MMPDKASVLLLLVLLVATISPRQVTGIICTNEQKLAIFARCKGYISLDEPNPIPPYYWSGCCITVQQVHIECIIRRLLTDDDLHHYNAIRMRNLEDLCRDTTAQRGCSPGPKGPLVPGCEPGLRFRD